MQQLTIYLSGEVHTDWRDRIIAGITSSALPVVILTPVTDHQQSDEVGAKILGVEEKAHWHDRKSAGINALRSRTAIVSADIVVVRFGDTYRQWYAAFDAGYAVAMGKPLITLHKEPLDHDLKDIDAAAQATAETPEQVVEILKYIITSK